MALIKSRPRIKLYLPASVTPGESFVANLELDAKKSVAVKSVRVTFSGVASATIGSGQYASTAKLSLASQQAALLENGEVPVGKSEYRVRFECPPTLPPMHRGRATSVDYTIEVRVDIPWWRDAVKSFVVPVQLRANEAERTANARVYSSAPDGPTGSEPHAEVSLADTTVEAGGVLMGAVALGNVEYARYVGVDVSLVGYERALVDGRRQESELSRHTLHLSTENAAEGAALPFRMGLPQVVPAFESEIVGVRYLLEVRARRRFARDLVLNLPIELLRGTAQSRDAAVRQAPPIVGHDRAERLWKKEGEPRGFELVDEKLVAQIGEVGVTVRRDHRGGRGVYLVTTLGYPSLDLGLTGGRMSALGRLFERGSVEPAPWDPSFGLNARDPEQVKAFAAALTAACSTARLTSFEDTRLEFEQRSSGLAQPALARFLDLALRVAKALPRARAAIPAPEGFDVEGWKTLANAVNGSLNVAKMSVRGELPGARLEIATEWSGQAPLETRVTVHFRSRIPAPLLGELRREGLEKLPERARSVAEGLFAFVETLLIDRDSMTALTTAPLASPGTASDWIPDLVALGEVLSVDQQVYR